MSRKNDHTGLWTVIQVLEITDVLKGERVCITGHLGLPRKQVQDIIRQAGGAVHKNLHFDTTILVSNGDFTATTIAEVKGKKKSSKMLRAEANNRNWQSSGVRRDPPTRILSEEDFCNLFIERSKAQEVQ